MATKTSEQIAHEIYDAWQANATQWRKMGSLRGRQLEQAEATLEQITAHVAACDRLAAQYHVSMDPIQMWGEDLPARALARCRVQSGKKAGRTLERRYGARIADAIVYEKSGQHRAR